MDYQVVSCVIETPEFPAVSSSNGFNATVKMDEAIPCSRPATTRQAKFTLADGSRDTRHNRL